MATKQQNIQDKTLIGYCEPLSLRAGEHIQLMASSDNAEQVQLQLVKIICGDPTRTGPGFKEIEIDTALPTSVSLEHQPIRPGSFAQVDLTGLKIQNKFEFNCFIYPTRPEIDQTIWRLIADKTQTENKKSPQDFALIIDNGILCFQAGSDRAPLTSVRLLKKCWYEVTVTVDDKDKINSTVSALPSPSPGRDFAHDIDVEEKSFPLNQPIGMDLSACYFARSTENESFDGRIARPTLTVDDVTLRWDFGKEIMSRKIIDVSGNDRHGLLHQLPARGVTGPAWDGSVQDWKVNPDHYDAIHFHSDDVYDVEWPVTTELALDKNLASGIYAFRLSNGLETDRIPFFVRPAEAATTADIALLMSSCTYMAYANHRMLFEGADFVAARNRLRPEHEYIRQHRELGPSMYEKHDDGSGVMYSSRRRPILQLRPGADGWNFTPDTDINAFMDHLELEHDILGDEDLHVEGLAALEPYKVIVTGSHPEYWSTNMLNAIRQWSRNGGRLIYLGGNGFYWRVAFNDDWPGAIELRRAEDGVRNWSTEPGESYHSFNGEYGGLWRRLGSAPNELVGIGFAAQGFERAVGYQRNPASYDSRAAWIFDGVEDEMIGTSGLGGGAAGQEVDSFNPDLGSPEHALVLASATDFGPDMTRTKEELDASIVVPDPDPVVRADMVFFETPAGGAVFSVGSISWFGALARHEYDNDVAKITANVMKRFLDPSPFEKNNDK